MVRLMSKKPCFSGALDREDDKWVETLLQSEETAPLQDLLTTPKEVALEKVSFSDTKNPTTFC